MANFREYIQDNILSESLIQEVKAEELPELLECLNECEARLDELLGLGKLAAGIKKLSDKGDKKAEEIKTGTKEFVEKGKDVAKGITKDIVGGVKKHASEVAQSHVEIVKAGSKKAGEMAKEAKDKFVKISAQSREAFKKMFSKLGELSDDQKKVVAELEPLFIKLQDGKNVQGGDAIKILASVLTSNTDGSVGNYKKFLNALENLRTKPGFSNYKMTFKKI